MTQIRYTALLLVFLGTILIQLNAQPTFSAIPNEANLSTNAEVCVDIVADNFADLVGFGFPLVWNPDVLQFQEIRNINIPGLERNDFDFSRASLGRFSLAWVTPDNVPVTLNDGFVLFKACFTSTENCGSSTIMDIDTTGMTEGRITYADRAFSINDQIIGVNIGFYDQDASLVVPCPCALDTEIVSSSPILSEEGYIDVCLGEAVSLEGEVEFEEGFEPTEGLTYIWDLGDGTILNTASLSHTYTDPGIYKVTFKAIDELANCETPSRRLRLRVAPEPIVELTQDMTFCPNESISLSTAELTMVAGTATGQSTSSDSLNVIPEAFREDTLLLPDGGGVAHQSELILDVFEEDASMQQASDIAKICINMEHSWARDLQISLTCPNGHTVILHDFAGLTGNRIRLGEPNETDNTFPIPGIGYTYCWSMDASNGTWLDYNEEVNPNNIVLDLPAGDYQPVQSFDAFVGCPLNGTWTLEVEDFWAQDNGYIFNWGIIFDETLIPEPETFSPAILDFAWQDHPDATFVSAEEIILLASTTGTLEVPYIISDELGCMYEQSLSVVVENTAACGCLVLPRLDLPANPKCSGNGQSYSVRVNTDPQNTLEASSGIIAGSSGFLTVYNIPAGEDVVVNVINPEGCMASATVEAPNCNDCPPMTAPQSFGNLTICQNEVLPSLEVSAAGINSSSEVRWYTANTGGSLLARGFQFFPTAAGTYYAEIYDNTTNCRSPRTAVSLNIENAPMASITGDFEICEGERTVLTAIGGVSYVWNNFATSNKVGVRAGTYSVTVSNANGCEAVASATVTERSCTMPCPPKAAPQSNGDVEVCAGETIPPLSVTRAGVNLTSEVRWYTTLTGGTFIHVGFEFSATEAGIYYAEIYDTANDCPSPRRAIRLSIIECLGTSPKPAFNRISADAALDIQIQPNPFQTATMLDFQQVQADWVKLSVYDVTGNVLHQQHIYFDEGQYQIPLEAELFVAKGVYFCRLETREISVTRKLIRQ